MTQKIFIFFTVQAIMYILLENMKYACLLPGKITVNYKGVWGMSKLIGINLKRPMGSGG